jgi:hypothetical protein
MALKLTKPPYKKKQKENEVGGRYVVAGNDYRCPQTPRLCERIMDCENDDGGIGGVKVSAASEWQVEVLV